MADNVKKNLKKKKRGPQKLKSHANAMQRENVHRLKGT